MILRKRGGHEDTQIVALSLAASLGPYQRMDLHDRWPIEAHVEEIYAKKVRRWRSLVDRIVCGTLSQLDRGQSSHAFLFWAPITELEGTDGEPSRMRSGNGTVLNISMAQKR
jgi:hypothetical protein